MNIMPRMMTVGWHPIEERDFRHLVLLDVVVVVIRRRLLLRCCDAILSLVVAMSISIVLVEYNIVGSNTAAVIIAIVAIVVVDVNIPIGHGHPMIGISDGTNVHTLRC